MKSAVFGDFLLRISPHSNSKRTKCLSAYSPNMGKYDPEKFRIRTPFMQWYLTKIIKVTKKKKKNPTSSFARIALTDTLHLVYKSLWLFMIFLLKISSFRIILVSRSALRNSWQNNCGKQWKNNCVHLLAKSLESRCNAKQFFRKSMFAEYHSAMISEC